MKHLPFLCLAAGLAACVNTSPTYEYRSYAGPNWVISGEARTLVYGSEITILVDGEPVMVDTLTMLSPADSWFIKHRGRSVRADCEFTGGTRWIPFTTSHECTVFVGGECAARLAF